MLDIVRVGLNEEIFLHIVSVTGGLIDILVL